MWEPCVSLGHTLQQQQASPEALLRGPPDTDTDAEVQL